MRKILVYIFVFIVADLSVIGQSSIEVNTGFIKPFPVLSNDPHYTSGSSANYNLSFYLSSAYKLKVSDKFFLGLNLSFNNYKLDFYEKTAIHPGLDEHIKDLAYNFNYLNLSFYPEFVIGNKVKYYVNAGVFGGIFLNGTKTGVFISSRAHWGPDGPYMEITETEIDGNAEEDLLSFTLGVQLGTGLRYQVSSNWKVHLNTTGRFMPFPVENEFTRSQLDLIISIGAGYSFNKKKRK